MIDWLSGIIPYSGPDISGGRFLVLSPDGDIIRESLQMLDVDSESHSVNVKLKSIPGGLWFSGNPSKWLQGHNLFGLDCLYPLAHDFLMSVFSKSAINDLGVITDVNTGNFRLTRVDLTHMYDCGSTENVRRWLRAATVCASGKHQKVSDYKGRTLYLGKNSKRMTIKAYCKSDEIQDHPISNQFPPDDYRLLTDYADSKLRIELTLRKETLHNLRLDDPKNWTYSKSIGVYNMKIRNLKIDGTFEIPDVELKMLPNKYKAVYELWMNGKSIRDYLSRPTYFRHKKYFRETWGINIDLPRGPRVDNVVPLLRIIEAKPVGVPSWAYDRGLIHIAA